MTLYPDLRLNLQILAGDSVPSEKSLDVVIRPGPLVDSASFVRDLLQIRLGAYASPAYLQNRTLPQLPPALREMSCITTSCGVSGEPADSATWRLHRGSDVHEIRVESRISVSDPSINLQLALDGVGVALLSQAAANPHVEQGLLVRLLPDWEPEPASLHAVYPSRLHASPKVRALLEFLRKKLLTFSRDATCSPAFSRN